MENRVALLIDAENTSVKYIEDIESELNTYDNITIKRMYGDFTSGGMKEWSDEGVKYAILPIHQARYAASKNASDIMLVIDAMDILYQNLADIICIVSSDSDFTRLACRLREGGKRVIGMGKSNASKTFIATCNVFIFLDKISEIDEEIEESRITPIPDIKKALDNILDRENENGNRLNLGEVKKQLKRVIPDFNERFYGYSKFSKFIEDELHLTVLDKKYIISNKEGNILANVEAYIRSKAKERISLGTLGKEVHEHYPDFIQKETGYSKFSKYVNSISGIKTIHIQDGSQQLVVKE